MNKSWMITGVSSGFGRELMRIALSRGDRVVSTVRNAAQVSTFVALGNGEAKALLLDVTDAGKIRSGMATYHGSQAGDIISALDVPELLMRLVLSPVGLAVIHNKLAVMSAELEAWAAFTSNTSFLQ